MYVTFNEDSHTETDVTLIAHQKYCISYIYFASLCSAGVSESVHATYLPVNVQH